MAGFALMDAVNINLTPVGESTPTITIDYANSSSLSLDSETKFAKKGGVNAVAFPGSKSGTFSLDAEVITEDWLALSMGGTLVATNNVITVKGVSDVLSYKIEGTFNVKMEDGTVKQKDLVVFSASPQSKAELKFSTDEISAFTLTFDLMADANGDLLTLQDHVDPA